MAEHAETAVYRTAQEALQNVAKHAGAAVGAGAAVCGSRTASCWRSADDGTGFDTGQRRRPGPARPGSAWPACGERAELLGGHLDLAATPGRGTTVRLTIPFLPAAQSAG